MNTASGIILAGGQSRRMGRDKAWSEFQGRALIEHVMASLEQVCAEIIVVANNQTPYRKLAARVVSDILPDHGSLGGIYSGLHAAQFDHAIVVACDMPFLNPLLLRHMLTLADEYEVVVPSAVNEWQPVHRPKYAGSGAGRGGPDAGSKLPTAKDSNLHPLHAVYAKQCLQPIETHLRAGDLRIISFYPEVRVRVLSQIELEQLDPKHLSLFNANTPEQLALAETIAQE